MYEQRNFGSRLALCLILVEGELFGMDAVCCAGRDPYAGACDQTGDHSGDDRWADERGSEGGKVHEHDPMLLQLLYLIKDIIRYSVGGMALGYP